MLLPTSFRSFIQQCIFETFIILKVLIGYMSGKFNLVFQFGLNAILLLAVLTSSAQTPIPGHAGKISDGSGGALLSMPSSVFVSGNYAYVASSGNNALEIVDISIPATPVHAGSITDGTGGALLGNPLSVFVSGNYAYIASQSSGALEIVDVTDKTNPIHLASLTDGTGGALLASPLAVHVSGTKAYVVSGISNSLEIIDVTDPSSPAHLGSIVDGAGGALLNDPSSVFVLNTTAYVASTGSNAIEIIDVSDPTTPVHRGSLLDGGGALLNAPASITVSGNYAYVASSGSNAIEIVDVTDGTAPVHLSSLINGGSAMLGNPQSVFLQGNYLYVVSNSSNALEIVDVTDPSSPQHYASLINGAGGAVLGAPTSVVVSGLSAFVTSSSGNALEVIALFTPLAPTATSATAILENGFTANWTNVSNAASFKVDVSTDNFATLVSGYNGATASGTSLVVSGLTGCTDYQFRVRGVNANGTSLSSDTVLVTTGVTTPSASSATAIAQTSFTANWNSISCATGYFLDVATDAGFSLKLASYDNLPVAGTTQSVNGLIAGTTYYYRVRSTNASGTSSNSNTISKITLPVDPTAVAASSFTQTGFTANWNSVTGASSYDLDIATDSGFGSIVSTFTNLSSTSKSVTSLNPGVTYYYRVRSVNASGASSNSNTISSITLPADPTAVAASSFTQTGFTANWNSVTGASSYDLDVAIDSGFGSIVSTFTNLSSTSKSVTSLNSGVTYYYRVRSVNASGASSNSNTISTITISANPTAIAAIFVTQTTFTADWNSISGASSYELDVATDAAFTSVLLSYDSLSVSGSSQTVTGLTAGTAYFYRLRSVNASGTSFNSNTISLATIPGNPVATSATAISQSSFNANWNAVAGAGNYRLDVSSNSGFTGIVLPYNNISVSGTSLNVTGLISGTTYYYRVRSANTSGTSSNSNTISAITIPPDPTATAASSFTQTGFTANWNSATGASGYDLDVATDSGFGSIIASFPGLSSNAKSVTALTAGVTYYYRVRATNGSGTSSNSNTITTITISADPTAIAASLITQSDFIANWNSVSGASSYLLDVAADVAFVNLLPSFNSHLVSGTSQSVTGLSSAATYYYRVRSTNASGTSFNSNVISVLTVSASPTNIAASVITQNSFIANWNLTSGASGYYLDVASDVAFSTLLPSYTNLAVAGTSQSVSGLAAGTTYYYRVRSTNASGTSLNSNVISTITIPADPTATAANAITQNSFTANWNLVTGASGYNLDVATDAAFTSILTSYNGLSVSMNSQSVTGLVAGTNYYYRVKSKNASGSSSLSNVVTLQTNQASSTQVIPTLSSGGTLESYSMFSVPMVLQNNDSSINTLFGSLGEYTPDKWRLLRWNSASSKWDEYQKGISTIDRGKSYWFNAKDQVSISVTGTPFVKSSFALLLNPGWNQIGSPYTFDVSWADVRAKNTSVPGVSLVESTLYKYNSSTTGFDKTDNLKAWGGAFVFNGGNAITLKIPITVVHGSGRISSNQTIFSNAEDWFLPLTLRVGDTENNYSGFGMHAEAISSYDKFDGITVPRFMKYLELNSHHSDFFEPEFARDVVTTAKGYNWHFMAESNLGNEDAMLTWNSQSVGDNETQLLLFDPATGSLVDMKQNSHYNFKIQGKHPLHFFYATDKESLKPDITALATVYPNPVSTSVTFPIFIANANEQSRIEIDDSMGKAVKSLGVYGSGLHLEQWDCTDNQGARVAAGMYIYRFVGENNLMQTGKLIVK